jgi:hypothetical protein
MERRVSQEEEKKKKKKGTILRTSKVCHQSSTEDWATGAGLATYAAPMTSTSQVPTAAATPFSAFSSVMLTAWTETSALCDARPALVSRSADSVRPRRAILLAPARAKAEAVSRPMPLPCDGDVSVVILEEERSVTDGADDYDRLPSDAEFWARRRDGIVCVVVPVGDGSGEGGLHDG